MFFCSLVFYTDNAFAITFCIPVYITFSAIDCFQPSLENSRGPQTSVRSQKLSENRWLSREEKKVPVDVSRLPETQREDFSV